MKKVKKISLALLPSFLVLGFALPSLINNSSAGKDTAIYDQGPAKAQLNKPDIVSTSAEGEEAIEVNKVILHYYNDDAKCAERAFYIWITGKNGQEFNLDNASDIVSVSADGTMLNIEIDFSDARFEGFDKKSSLFFIVKYKMRSETDLNWAGQSDDVQLRYENFPPVDKVCEVWAMPAAGGGVAVVDSEAKLHVHGVKLATFTDWKTIQCETTDDTQSVDWKLYAFDETYFKSSAKSSTLLKWYLVKSGSSNQKSFTIDLKYEAHINIVYSLVSHDPSSDNDPGMKDLDKTVTVGLTKLYDSPKFKQYYDSYTGHDLGVTYTKEATTFKVWSPVSANMTLLVYDTDTSSDYGGDDAYKGYHMYYKSGGIWELTVKGDLAGKYYNYQVDNTLGKNVVMDPYATSAGCNGLRGLIYDKEQSNPEGWDALPLKWDGVKDYDLETPQDLTIYEVHIQDLTGDESWVSNKNNKRGTYNAFVESGTRLTGTDVTTGYDHLNDLGIGAVQLVPVFDHDNDESSAFDEDGNPTEQVKYNWGYNPLNYNVVEGGYSSNPHDGLARVKEFKNLVLQMSKTEAHTRVIMDVVYNHVSSANDSCFHKLMPRYYFRYTPEGELFDGSGCHNEVASERPMMRKFIVDSLCMWAKEYKIKGFRFDLMGLIDFKTMNAVQKALYQIDPDIYIYGEGWSLRYNGPSGDNYGTETWQVYNECNKFKVGNDSVYLGGFNDCFRNAVRGENGWGGTGKTYPGAGFVQNGNWKQGQDGSWYCDYETLNKIADGLWGTNYNITTDGAKSGYYPEQTVNYISCHDNWTVRDQLFNTLPKRDDSHPASLESILRASLQAHTLVMAGNAAAFILGGEELLRTKEYTDDPSNFVGVTADSWTELWGHYISHNSYNAPLSVNSFKWGNKVKVTCGDDEITNATYHYVEAFQTLIKSHKGLLKKRGENNGYDAFTGSTSTGSGVWNKYWSEDGNFSNCVAFQANEAFVYTCAGNIGPSDYIQCDESAMAKWQKIFEYGSYNISDNKVYFGQTNMVLYYDRHGK